MNKRKSKKLLKRTRSEALVNQNEYLKRENAKLRHGMAEALEGLAQAKTLFDAHIGALAKLHGERIEGYSVIELPMEVVKDVISDYEVKCSIEGGKYIICVLPKVDEKAE